MRILVVLLSLLYGTYAAGEVSNCNYVVLVKCFINILDEWAWTLYELKDNVVTITQEQCAHLTELDKCIKDEGKQHSCSHGEIVEVSNTVSDLLTHRKDSGTFLRSYYLLKYSCSPEGQQILTNHRECLKQEKIGEMTLSAGTYLSEKFLQHSDDEVCEKVNEKLQEYITAMNGLCAKHEAAKLMCKSLTDMFHGLHADKLGACVLDCKVPDDSSEESAVPLQSDSQDVENIEQQPSETDALRPADSSSPLHMFINFAVGLIILYR